MVENEIRRGAFYMRPRKFALPQAGTGGYGIRPYGAVVGGGVPDAPRRLAPTSFPGLPPAETPAAANTRGGVKTPPYGPNH